MREKMSAASSISLNNSLINFGLNIGLTACLGGMMTRYFEPIFLQKGLLAGALVGATNSLGQEAVFSTGKVERDPFTKTIITGATLAVLFFASGTTAAASLLNRVGLQLPESLLLNIFFGSAVIGQGLSLVEASKVVRDATKERDEATKKVDDATKKVDDATKKVEDATKLAKDVAKVSKGASELVAELAAEATKAQAVGKNIMKEVDKAQKMANALFVLSGCTILACIWQYISLSAQCEQ